MRGDGDGWVVDPDGTRYWGRFGAAGLLLVTRQATGAAILLQHRAIWSHQGGTWALPGGARDSHETSEQAAVREAGEEAGVAAADVRVERSVVTHRGATGWTYTTVIASVPEALGTVANGESTELRWVPVGEVSELPLHPAFALAWPALQQLL